MTPYLAQILSSSVAQGPATSITYNVRVFKTDSDIDINGVIPSGDRPTAYDIVAAQPGTRYIAWVDSANRWIHEIPELPLTTECA